MNANGRLYVIDVSFRIPVDGTRFMIRADAAARCSLRGYSGCMAHLYMYLSVYISLQMWLSVFACLICPSHGVLCLEARMSDRRLSSVFKLPFYPRDIVEGRYTDLHHQ